MKLIILNFSTFHKELTLHLTGQANKWVTTIHPLVTWSWHFVRICLNNFYAHAKSIKDTAFGNFKLFPENQPSNKIGSNNNKQIKLYETARIAKAKQRGMLPQSNFESYCFYLYMVQHFLIFKAKILEILQEVLSLDLWRHH